MARGYDRLLYVLPFDHRGSFQSGLFGWKAPLDAGQTAEIAASKRVIYDGFLAAVTAGTFRDKAAILVDEQFGAAILRDAATAGFTTALAAEKSGQAEFEFEYGDDFARHVEAFRPTFSKVLVRYNPGSDPSLNRRQAERLKRLSDYLATTESRFMFELLVPADPAQLAKLGGDKHAYDLDLRPGLMVRAIQELQAAGVEPDIWKVEGLDRGEDCEAIVEVARSGGRDHVDCIVLGRGEDPARVRLWLTVAARTPGFIGFAVGRTVFWDPLVAWLAKTATREEAVAEIARRYTAFVDLFDSARPSTTAA